MGIDYHILGWILQLTEKKRGKRGERAGVRYVRLERGYDLLHSVPRHGAQLTGEQGRQRVLQAQEHHRALVLNTNINRYVL